jgi:hypothetical protein
LLAAVDGPTRRRRREVADKIREELLRLEHSGNPGARRFSAAMRERYPEMLRVEIEAASL